MDIKNITIWSLTIGIVAISGVAIAGLYDVRGNCNEIRAHDAIECLSICESAIFELRDDVRTCEDIDTCDSRLEMQREGDREVIKACGGALLKEQDEVLRLTDLLENCEEPK